MHLSATVSQLLPNQLNQKSKQSSFATSPTSKKSHVKTKWTSLWRFLLSWRRLKTTKSKWINLSHNHSSKRSPHSIRALHPSNLHRFLVQLIRQATLRAVSGTWTGTGAKELASILLIYESSITRCNRLKLPVCRCGQCLTTLLHSNHSRSTKKINVLCPTKMVRVVIALKVKCLTIN